MIDQFKTQARRRTWGRAAPGRSGAGSIPRRSCWRRGSRRPTRGWTPPQMPRRGRRLFKGVGLNKREPMRVWCGLPGPQLSPATTTYPPGRWPRRARSPRAAGRRAGHAPPRWRGRPSAAASGGPPPCAVGWCVYYVCTVRSMRIRPSGQHPTHRPQPMDAPLRWRRVQHQLVRRSDVHGRAAERLGHHVTDAPGRVGAEDERQVRVLPAAFVCVCVCVEIRWWARRQSTEAPLGVGETTA